MIEIEGARTDEKVGCHWAIGFPCGHSYICTKICSRQLSKDQRGEDSRSSLMLKQMHLVLKVTCVL